MLNLYNTNGLMFWSEREISQRESLIVSFTHAIKQHLYNMNSAWRFERCEAPILTPAEFINKNYLGEDIYRAANLSYDVILILRYIHPNFSHFFQP